MILRDIPSSVFLELFISKQHHVWPFYVGGDRTHILMFAQQAIYRFYKLTVISMEMLIENSVNDGTASGYAKDQVLFHSTMMGW